MQTNDYRLFRLQLEVERSGAEKQDEHKNVPTEGLWVVVFGVLDEPAISDKDGVKGRVQQDGGRAVQGLRALQVEEAN